MEPPNLGDCTLTSQGYVDEQNNVIAPLQKLIPLAIRPGSIFLPEDISPLILIGPGTGIAPMRSIIHERGTRKELCNSQDSVGPVDLYFGCRKKSKDFYYEDEWRDLLEKGVIQSLYTAFSRDQTAKEYVQLRLYENRQKVAEWLMRSDTHLFIAGSAKRMPNDVAEVLCSILSEIRGFTEQEAQKRLRRLSAERRYVVEAWA
jgi:NADPH-ferrihemoprotein reductase